MTASGPVGSDLAGQLGSTAAPPDLAGPPPPGTPIPEAMTAYTNRHIDLVWLNGIGGITGVIRRDPPQYIKWNPPGSHESLAAEANRLFWLSKQGFPTPKLVEYQRNNSEELLITEAVPASNAVAPRWKNDPDVAARAVAEGLKALHALPTDGCPFTWEAQERLQACTQNAGTDCIPSELAVPRKHSHPEPRDGQPCEKVPVGSPPPIDKLVICHGDACTPNTLVSSGGEFAGLVDLGRLGLADRWADLAVAEMSLGWNYPDFNRELFWETYGIEPDQERLAYYRDLWNAEA